MYHYILLIDGREDNVGEVMDKSQLTGSEFWYLTSSLTLILTLPLPLTLTLSHDHGNPCRTKKKSLSESWLLPDTSPTTHPLYSSDNKPWKQMDCFSTVL